MVLVIDVLVVVDVASATGVVVVAAAVLVVGIGANVATVVSPEAVWHAAASSAAPMRMVIGRNELIGQRCYGASLFKRCIVEWTLHRGGGTTFTPRV